MCGSRKLSPNVISAVPHAGRGWTDWCLHACMVSLALYRHELGPEAHHCLVYVFSGRGVRGRFQKHSHLCDEPQGRPRRRPPKASPPRVFLFSHAKRRPEYCLLANGFAHSPLATVFWFISSLMEMQKPVAISSCARCMERCRG